MPTIRAIGDGDLTGEPFFAAVRRRHRDVDIVLLPPESPTPAGEPPPREELEALPGLLATELVDLWESVAGRIELAGDVQPHFLFGSVEGSVRCEVRAVGRHVPVEPGLAALSATRRGLLALGWEVGAPDTGVPRVLAHRGAGNDRRALVVTYLPEQRSYSVTLCTGPLGVGRASARRLVRRDRGAS